MPVEGGTQYEMTTSSPQDNSTATSRVRWEQQRVLLLFSSLTLPGLARYDCTYIPPVEVLHLPLAVGALPRQSWSSDECSGTLDTSVLGVEEVQAAGRRWRAWKIQSRGTYRIGGAVDGTVEAVNWFAPELGVAVKAEVTNDATLTGRPFKSRQITLLRSHP